MLNLNDPLEAVRSEFRKLWSIREASEAEAFLKRIFMESVQPLLETNPSWDQDFFQGILFEEKRRLEDIELISSRVCDRLRLGAFSNPADLAIADLKGSKELSHSSSHESKDRIEIDCKEEAKLSAVPLVSVSEGRSSGGLDLAGMIDHMLEEERNDGR